MKSSYELWPQCRFSGDEAKTQELIAKGRDSRHHGRGNCAPSSGCRAMRRQEEEDRS